MIIQEFRKTLLGCVGLQVIDAQEIAGGRSRSRVPDKLGVRRAEDLRPNRAAGVELEGAKAAGALQGLAMFGSVFPQDLTGVEFGRRAR